MQEPKHTGLNMAMVTPRWTWPAPPGWRSPQRRYAPIREQRHCSRARAAEVPQPALPLCPAHRQQHAHGREVEAHFDHLIELRRPAIIRRVGVWAADDAWVWVGAFVFLSKKKQTAPSRIKGQLPHWPHSRRKAFTAGQYHPTPGGRRFRLRFNGELHGNGMPIPPCNSDQKKNH